jgi:hypothetical protein
MHLGAALGLLPRPRPTLDVDRTILVHQVEAACTSQEAEVVLLGDSSCLMDVSARQLSAQLGLPARNLGAHSYLDLKAMSELLRRYVLTNPDKLRLVVLLLHPEALRRMAPEAYHVRVLHGLLGGVELPLQGSFRERLLRVSGLEHFQGRLLCRALPTPLHGAYARYYGFSSNLDAFMARNLGSAVDPERRPFQGNAEYRLAPQLEAASRAFREAVPTGARLAVGITPVPAGFAPAGYEATRDQMLRQWSEWVRADVTLKELPAVLPGYRFAQTTHLSEAGARAYTETLAPLLKPYLP